MGKLRLDVDSVQVESFITAAPEAMRGTVRAKSDTFDPWCFTFQDTCFTRLNCHSFQATCWNAGCNSGMTAPDYCPTAANETCAGWADCPGTGQNSQYTCEGTCSDYGCTVCNAWC